MSTPYFRFKQFTIYHDRCAMKVGTDGVLLGCWVMPTPTPSLKGGQAKENMRAGSIYLSRLQEWNPGYEYDLIVSNPPYFQNSLKNPDKGREMARHTDSLSYEELLSHSARLLTMHGQLAIILPADAEQEICTLAAQHSLYLTHVTRVYSKENKPARRVLLQFEKSDYRAIDISVVEDTLVLEDDKGGRSRPYQELAKDFYL